MRCQFALPIDTGFGPRTLEPLGLQEDRGVDQGAATDADPADDHDVPQDLLPEVTLQTQCRFPQQLRRLHGAGFEVRGVSRLPISKTTTRLPASAARKAATEPPKPRPHDRDVVHGPIQALCIHLGGENVLGA